MGGKRLTPAEIERAAAIYAETGNAAAAGYGALVAFGGVLALGGSIESGLVAVGGATLYGLGLGADPETARKPAVPPPSEEVPT